MSKYIIEENINFYEELMKEEDEYEENSQNNKEKGEGENNICLITFGLFDENKVTLPCQHSFNYKPLFYELINQKIINNTNIYQKYGNHNIFFMCPYCRKDVKHNFLLPYIEELIDIKIYGINTDEKEYKINYKLNYNVNNLKKCSIELCNKLGYNMLHNELYCIEHFNEKKYPSKNTILPISSSSSSSHPISQEINKNKSVFCKVILKYGLNKGKECGVMNCKRKHSTNT